MNKFHSKARLFGACAAALVVIPCADAVILTLINPEDQYDATTNPAGVQNLDENVNQAQSWVMGGASSGVTYTSQRSAVFTNQSGPGGNGNFGSFLGTDDAGKDPIANTTEQGHNTDQGTNGAGGQYEVQSGGQTNDVQLSQLGIVSLVSGANTPTDPTGTSFTNNEVVGGNYFAIGFDMNPIPGGTPHPHITYSQIQVWISPTQITQQFEAGPTGNDLGTLVWDLDADVGVGEDHSLTLHESNNGSGTTDMLMYIPVEDVLTAGAAVTSDYFLYLWVELETYGETNANQHGFISGDPDSAYIPPGGVIPVPETSQFALIFGTMAVLMTTLRRRLNRV